MGEVIATYLVYDRKGDLEKKAEQIALGLTVGSWTDLPKLLKEQLQKHKGRVVKVEKLPQDERSNAFFGQNLTRGLLQIAYPSVNFTFDLPAILVTVFGKLSLDGEIKLIDLTFSDDLVSQFPGPKFGVDGIREQLQVKERPLFMSIFKTMIGRDLDYFGEQLRQQALGGVDLVKDDEIMFDLPGISLKKRIQKAKEVLKEVEEETGQKTWYVANLTGRTHQIIDKAKRAVEWGADALLFNVFAYGLDVLQALSEESDVSVPIMVHPAFSGAITSSMYYGVAHSLLLGKLLRLAGADFVLFPSPYGSVALEKEQALGIGKALTESSPVLRRAFPVPSAGIHPGLVPLLIQDFGVDVVINAGGGVHGHPEGATAGGRAFRQAIAAVLAGRSLEEAASENNELNIALNLWGGKRN